MAPTVMLAEVAWQDAILPYGNMTILSYGHVAILPYGNVAISACSGGAIWAKTRDHSEPAKAAARDAPAGSGPLST